MTTSSPPIAAPVSLRATGAARRRLHVERAVRLILGTASALTVVITVLIVLSLVGPTLEFFEDVSVKEFFTGFRWGPLFNPPRFGIWPVVVGTLWTTGIAILVAVPLGLGAAFYLSQYARPSVRKVIKPILEILAGIPTVVFGFFALNFVNPEITKKLWPFADVGTFSALSAGIVVGIMILPTVASLAEDAMSAVPQGLKQGAYALGSTRREVCTSVVFPAALSGIVSAVVLAASRAIGETTIILIAAGTRPELTTDPSKGMQTLTSFIGFAAIGDQQTGSTGYKTIFAVGSLLFLVTLALNMISIRLVRRFREVYE